MKGLRQFQKFDTQAFFNDKKLVALAVSPVFEYSNGERTDKIIGTKIETVISQDDTKYTSDVSNVFEKLNIKVIDDVNFEIPEMVEFKILRFEKVTVFGQFQNQLSIEVKAENVKFNQ